ACERASQWERTLALFGELRRTPEPGRSAAEKVSGGPNTATYNTVLGACQKAEQWNQALQLLLQLRSSSLELDALAYSVTAFACSGSSWNQGSSLASPWQLALLLAVDAVLASVPLDTSCCGGLLAECEQRGLAGAEAAFKEQLQHLPVPFTVPGETGNGRKDDKPLAVGCKWATCLQLSFDEMLQAPMVQELVRLLEERGLPGPTQLSSAECAEDFAVRLLAARRDSLEKALALATSDEDWRRDLNLSSYASKHDPREILGGVDPAVLQSYFLVAVSVIFYFSVASYCC
ncbi:unnamed protein product, partial [Polarella glacialis]